MLGSSTLDPLERILILLVFVILQGCAADRIKPAAPEMTSAAPPAAMDVREPVEVGSAPPPRPPSPILGATVITGKRLDRPPAKKRKLNLKVSPSVLGKGNAVYFVPKTMTVGTSSRVELWVDMAAPLDQLQAAFSKYFDIPMENIKFPARLARVGLELLPVFRKFTLAPQ